MQRKLQVAGRHEEERHAGTDEGIEQGGPVGIDFRQDQGALPSQVERFGRMDDHDHQAGQDAHPVDPDFARAC